jgi:hypothetical protein
MRIWDIPPSKLCRKHLLGMHSELHAIWNILTKDKRGYSKHPETMRWKGKLKALFKVHEYIVQEMANRGYKHNSPLDKSLAKGKSIQKEFIDPFDKQIAILIQKNCDCKKTL